jgi:predicted nucleotidyltransferase
MCNLEDQTNPIIESHYLETYEGLFFAVKGLVHPPDRFLGCLRYVPDPKGDRQKEGCRYCRLYHFAEQEQFLQAEYPHYLAFDPTCQVTLQSVPRACVRRVYDPRQCLQALLRSERDPVQEDALAFASVLQQEASIPWNGLGISGSVLIGVHTPRSDLDVTVYGTQNGWAVHRALKKLLTDGTSQIRKFDRHGVETLYAERVPDTRMSFDDFVRTEKDKVLQGQFRSRPYFIRFLQEPAEADESYGDFYYTPIGRAGIKATVTEASESIFTPCRYLLAAVHGVEGSAVEDVAEIVSYRGRFCEQAQAEDMIQARGTLERVQAKDGRVWHRLLLGNHPDDIMLAQR